MTARAEKLKPPTRAFSDGWVEKYKAAFGVKYFYQTKDGVSAARALKHSTPEELLSIAEAAWRKTDDKRFWNCVHCSKEVASFVSRLNAIQLELASEKKQQSNVKVRW
jgi:hypothetical protein